MSETPRIRVPRLPDDQAAVVAWLRTEQGEEWSRARIGISGRLRCHYGPGHYLAEIIPQCSPGTAAAMGPPRGGDIAGGRA